MKKRLCMVLCLLMILAVLPSQAAAAGTIDSNRELKLTLEYIYWEGTKEIPVSDVQFDLYFVADMNADGSEYTLTEDFAPYLETITDLDNLSGLNALQRRRLAINLKTLVEANAFTPCDSGSTNESGYAEFPSTADKQFKQGMYLVIGRKSTIDGYTYSASPSVVTLPSLNEETSAWEYEVTMQPKLSRRPAQEEEEKISVTVTKKWDDTDASARPSEITVYLYDGSELSETVTLNEENRWTYVWNNLSQGGDWSVAEDAVEHYSCSVERNGNTFVITNTRNADPIDSDESSDIDNPSDVDYPDDSNDGRRGKLPKTGVLWWPIPCMILLGIVCIVIGCELRKKQNEKSV